MSPTINECHYASIYVLRTTVLRVRFLLSRNQRRVWVGVWGRITTTGCIVYDPKTTDRPYVPDDDAFCGDITGTYELGEIDDDSRDARNGGSLIAGIYD